MKLHALRMQAFGPFAEQLPTTVDFAALSTTGLFTISGPTGSGKSTLLDAICFALYGETSGGDRESRDMRSQHAPANMETMVELDFTLGTGSSLRRFRFQRKPEQQVAGARGAGLVRRPHKATVWECDSDWKTGTVRAGKSTEATQLARDLLGLTLDQFRKVVVLPQGQFAAIIRDGNRDQRQEQLDLFDVLFGTQWTTEVIEKIRERFAEQERTLAQTHANQQALLRQAGVDSNQALDDAIHTAEQQLARANRNLARITRVAELRTERCHQARQIMQRLESAEQTQAEVAALEAEIPTRYEEQARLQRARAADRVAPVLDALLHAQQQANRAATEAQAAEQSLAQARTAHEQASAAAAAIPSLELQRDQAREQAQHWSRIVELFGSVAEAERQWMAAQAAASRAQNAHETLAADLRARQEKLTTVQTALEAARTQAATAPGIAQQLQNLRTAADTHRRLSNELASRTQLADKADQAGRDCALASRELLDAQARLRHLQGAYLAGQAIVLAGQLQPGKPCPVCGSTQHPAPAKIPPPTDGSDHNPPSPPTEAQLDQAANEVRLAETAELQARNHYAEVQQQLAQLDGRIQELRTGLQDWLDRAPELLAEIRALEAAHQAAQRAQAQALALTQESQTLSQSIEEKQAALGKAAESLQLAKQTEAHARGKYEQQRAGLPSTVANAEEATAQLQAAKQNAQSATDTIAALQAALSRADAALAGAISTLNAANEAKARTEKELLRARAAADEALLREGFTNPDGTPSIQSAQAARIPAQELQSREISLKNWQARLDSVRELRDRAALEARGLTRPDLSALNQRLVATQARVQTVNQRVGAIQQQVQALHKTRQALEELQRKNASEVRRQGALHYLRALLVDGRITGVNDERLNFREFVIGEMLAPVVEHGNRRFRRLTRGRYELRQQTLSLTPRKKSDPASPATAPVEFRMPRLRIHDTYLRQDRAVSTLSGGETFQLSLSLALGLGEAITAAQGGVQLDTVFIDEGFGTLDAEALDGALTVLTELRDSGRIVGVISHVEELHQRVGVTLQVVKGPDGRSQLLSRIP